MFNGIVTFLKAHESSFIGTKGDKIEMRYVTVLTDAGNVIELTATPEAYATIAKIESNSKVTIGFDIYEGSKRTLKIKISDVKAK